MPASETGRGALARTQRFPRFSIVMPSFNTAEYLRETIDSVIAQDYPDFEFLIVDGGSTDGTLEILRSYGGQIRWISEPDHGQCDALNKGFSMATGELLYWANADDPLELGALRHVAGLLTDLARPQWLAGAARLINGKGKEFAVRKVGKVDDATFLLWAVKWIPTQAVFWNRRMWDVAGPFNEDLHYVMDLGLWERMYNQEPCIITNEVLARYRLHDQSKSLTAISKSRVERKHHMANLIADDMSRARSQGETAVLELAARYAHLFDELSDQAALLERLNEHRLMGPLMRLYRRRTKWYPDFDV
jgi:hypothetical protein